MASPSDWNDLIVPLPGAHILQTSNWGALKARFSWIPTYYLWLSDRQGVSKTIFKPETVYEKDTIVAAALWLTRIISLAGYPLKIGYLPKGPLLDWQDQDLRKQVLADLAAEALRQGVIFLKIDPDVALGVGVEGVENCQDDPNGMRVTAELEQAGWHFSNEQVQFRNSMFIDLTNSEDELLAAMKPKTRYNVRLAERRGVTVRIGASLDIPLLYQMYAETSLRDGFVIRSQEYYQAVWGEFMKEGLAEALIAEIDGEAVAGLILFMFGANAWYLYGMSREVQREKMPNYLLQWVAMKRARQHGCSMYDLWGAPDNFTDDNPMWGVYRFKDGLGGTVVRRIGAWDLPVKPTIYRLYTQTLPRILNVMRRRGQEQTRHQLGT